MNVHLFFSKYIYEQKVLSFYLVIFFLSLSLLFLYLSRLPLFSPPLPSPSTPLLASSSPLSPRLIFLGAMRISSMARFRPPLETSHSTMPLVAPLDHDRPLRHRQPTLTPTVALLAKNQVRPIWLDFRASTGQISRMHVKEHIATANPRIRGFFIYEINVQSEADPNRTGNACSSRGAIVLFVPVCYSAQNSIISFAILV